MPQKSQNKLIFEYYQNGGKLTTLDALRLFGTMNLRSRNSDIEKMYNLKLKRDWVNNSETGKKYYVYYLKCEPKQMELSL